MSTKTISKRVALATVVALGAGVLSLVTVSSASASVTTLDATTVNGAAGAANYAGAATGLLFQATALSNSGAATASGNTSTSVGLINVSDVANGHTAGTTQTATLLSTGALAVYETGSASAFDVLQVTGGTISTQTGWTAMNTASTTLSSATGGSAAMSAVVKPASGATSMTIALYSGATASGSTAGGTLTGYITVTVAATSAAGVLSAANSGVWYANSNSGKTTLTADDTTASTPTAPDGGTAAYGVNQFATVRVRDAFGTAITSSSGGLLTATATNGALVAFASTTPTQSTAFSSTTIDGVSLTVAAPSNAPVSTVVTVAYNGTTLATKSFTFTGQVAKITLSSASNGALSSTGTATIAFADSAGNAVYPSSGANTGSGSAKYPLTNLLVDGNSTNAYITGASVTTAPTSSTGGVLTFTTGASAGSANLAVKYTNLDGTIISSNALKVSASDTPYSYTAALDKAKYNVGDIATLTVTFKDSKGNVANDNGGIASSTYVPAISGGLLGNTNGSTTTNGSSTDATTNGVATYKFVVGQPSVTPYAGQLLVSFGLVNSRNSGQSTQTVAYSIGDSGTSLNDVLKGIVSLIASINKQIAALAKLVSKK